MTFIRRFTSDPGLEVLIDIESVNILDMEPQAPITSAGYGTILLVGEFEKGPYATPTEVFGPSDIAQTFGGFGFVRGGVIANDPCARGRKADGAVNFEYWNGNGMVALNGKRFNRLVICRVDTSVGSVSITRIAAILGAVGPTFALAPGQTVIYDIGAGNVTKTFLGTQATYVGGGFPGGGGNSGFIGGEWVDIAWDGVWGGGAVRVYFQAADQTPAQVAARINLFAGFTFATVAGGGCTLTGRIYGTASETSVIAADAAGTLTKMGWTVNNAFGTGSAANLAATTVAEAQTLIGGVAVMVDTDSTGHVRISNYGTPGTGTIKVVSTSSATAFAFSPLDTVVSAALGVAGIIPAGTIVKTAGAVKWVTCDDITVTAASAGPYSVKIRPATDDGTTAGTGAGTVVLVDSPVDFSDWVVTNPLPIAAALSETAIDTAYLAAFDATTDISSVAKEVNTAYSARQSNAVRRKGRDNAEYASSVGCYGRRFCARPPLGTTRTVAKQVSEPGVQAYRSERLIYCYPGASVYMPAIATRGLAGGAGFTADGFVDCGADGFMAMLCSLLHPVENPGQITDYLNAVSGLESSPNAAGWNMSDYISFKACGIAALRMDSGVPEFQSGVTSVDPVLHAGQVTIARRRYADQMQDTLAMRAKPFGKKLGTKTRKNALLALFNDYFEGEKKTEHLDSYSVDGKKGNTASSLALGAYWIICNAKTIPSMDSIIVQCNFSPNADTTVTAT